MEMNYTDLSATWPTIEEAKQAVVEQTLFQVFNPFKTLQDEQQPIRENSTVVSYTVQQGDTLSDISRRYGVTLQELIEENKITNPNLVGIGMKLILTKNETTHTVERDETLESIAKRYYVSEEEIVTLNPMLKILENNLFVGQQLRIPVANSKPMMSRSDGGLRRQLASMASRSNTRARMMEWPIASPTVTSGFGIRWGKLHKGIDIWNEEKGNTPILAAKDGRVIEADANRTGYGYMVVLDHGDGLQTMYAHMRKITVHVGEEVKSGETVGFMGKTGDSTGYHLHFEVRQDNVPLNPLSFLTR